MELVHLSSEVAHAQDARFGGRLIHKGVRAEAEAALVIPSVDPTPQQVVNLQTRGQKLFLVHCMQNQPRQICGTLQSPPYLRQGDQSGQTQGLRMKIVISSCTYMTSDCKLSYVPGRNKSHIQTCDCMSKVNRGGELRYKPASL
jgi:hypothetical protein